LTLAIGAVPKCVLSVPHMSGRDTQGEIVTSFLSLAVSTMMALCRGIVAHAQQWNQTNLVSSNSGVAPVAEAQLLHVGLRSTLAGLKCDSCHLKGR
jgi:hypothetical protein